MMWAPKRFVEQEMDDNDRDMQIAEAICERFEWDGRVSPNSGDTT